MFEFDRNKSRSNLEKHGISFSNAQKIWKDPYLLEIPTKSLTEPRYIVIGKLNNKLWTAVITYRNQHIRLISVRRSRKEEEKLYESKGF